MTPSYTITQINWVGFGAWFEDIEAEVMAW